MWIKKALRSYDSRGFSFCPRIIPHTSYNPPHYILNKRNHRFHSHDHLRHGLGNNGIPRNHITAPQKVRRSYSLPVKWLGGDCTIVKWSSNKARKNFRLGGYMLFTSQLSSEADPYPPLKNIKIPLTIPDSSIISIT